MEKYCNKKWVETISSYDPQQKFNEKYRMHSFHTDGYHNFFEKNDSYRRTILITLLDYKSLFGLNFFFKTSHLLFETKAWGVAFNTFKQESS